MADEQVLGDAGDESTENAGGEATETVLGQEDETNSDENSEENQEEDKSSEGDEDTDHEKEDDEASENSEDDKEVDEEKGGAPENYDDFTVPDGMEVDKELLDEFVPIMKDLNASQEEAQKLVDAGSRLVQKTQTQIIEAQNKQWAETKQSWLDAAQKDEEIGGAKYEGALKDARLAIHTFGTPELINFFNESQTGDNHELIRIFSRIGKAIGEDTNSFGTQNKPQKSQAQRLFGKTTPGPKE